MDDENPKFLPLIEAVREQNYLEVEKLLHEDGLNPNLDVEDIHEKLENHYPLKISIEKDDPKMLELLIKYGLKYNTNTAHYKYSSWWSGKFRAIDYAVECNAIKIIKFLHSIGSEYFDSFYKAVRSGKLNIVKILVELYGRPVDIDYYVRLSIEYDFHDLFDYLINNVVERISSNMISTAAEFNKCDKLKKLMDNNISPNY